MSERPCVSTIISILSLQLLIVFHEMGHYLFAKLYGMRVARFSVGFGPQLLAKKVGETEFQLAAVPFGGFVQILGMSAEDGVGPEDPAAYPNKPTWQRVMVVVMGPVMNFAIAFVFLTLAYSLGVAQPDLTQPIVGEVMAGGAGERAGILAQDRILSINGKTPQVFSDIPTLLQATDSTQPVQLQVMRAGAEVSLTVGATEAKGPRLLGVAPPTLLKKSTGVLSALHDGLEGTIEKTASTCQALANIFTGKGSGRLMGLPGIVKTIGGSAERGVSSLALLLAVLSINLGLFNLLPFPALDGGRLIFLGYEAISRRKVDMKIENYVHSFGMILLLGLLVFVSVRDLLL